MTPSSPDADGGPAPALIAMSLAAEARNFDLDTWKEAAAECPLPVKELHKWSSLPPMEWVVSVPVVWGAAKFLGSFLERMGAATGDALVDWLKATSRKAREPERDRYVTLSFDLADGRQVFGFVPFAPDDDELLSVTAALESAGTLAEVAGRLNDGAERSAHRVAYLFDGSEWRLAWFVTDAGAYCTRFFADNTPDPERFLGGPVLPEFPTGEPQPPSD